VSFASVVRAAYLARVGLSSTGYYRTPGIWFDKASGRGKPFHYYACGAAIAEVEVDGFTGQVRVLRVDILHDVGSSLNPMIDAGQVEGGFIQGMGWVTMEEVVWGSDGRMLTHAPSTYKIPASTDVPADWRVSLLPRAAQPGVIYGSKAVGEPPFMLGLCVREAIRDAVASFAPPGSYPERVALALPATGEAILDAIDAVRG
jgi:xanthine dehydrogenase large subunit